MEPINWKAETIMTREIKTHHGADPINNKVVVEAWDDTPATGSNRVYRLSVNVEDHNQEIAKIKFHAGPGDVDGVTNEALLAVLIDRLRGFQNGPTSCRENAISLTKLEEALLWLQSRSRDRVNRGVIGTPQK